MNKLKPLDDERLEIEHEITCNCGERFFSTDDFMEHKRLTGHRKVLWRAWAKLYHNVGYNYVAGLSKGEIT